METASENPRVDAAAQAPARRAAPGEYLTFRVGTEDFGVEILQVQEIRSHEPPNRVVGSPPCVAGIINLRGVVVPVVDLRTILGSEAAITAATVVIVLSLGGQVIGAIVDSVSDVVELNDAALQPPPAGMAGSNALKGIGTAGDRMLLLLDMQRLLEGAGALPQAA